MHLLPQAEVSPESIGFSDEVVVESRTLGNCSRGENKSDTQTAQARDNHLPLEILSKYVTWTSSHERQPMKILYDTNRIATESADSCQAQLSEEPLVGYQSSGELTIRR